MFEIFYKSMSEADNKIRGLCNAFMEAETSGEVRKIIKDNVEFMMDYPDTFQFAVNALERIKIVNYEKIKSYKSILN